MRYFLPSPLAKGSHLREKTPDGSPTIIFHCKTSNTLWKLYWTITDGRILLRYDPTTHQVDWSQKHAVPQDWEGDPQIIGITEEVWRDLNHPDYSTQKEHLKDILRNGDILCVVDGTGHCRTWIELHNGQLTPKPAR